MNSVNKPVGKDAAKSPSPSLSQYNLIQLIIDIIVSAKRAPQETVLKSVANLVTLLDLAAQLAS